ncbi:MAG: mechanosensitive ion channel family protein [Chromatiales bacterium]|nr:mechanosensitive ion channel family protein [Chromatiales bacterium]
MNATLDFAVLGNSVGHWLAAAALAAACAVVLAVALRVVRVRVTAWAASTAGRLDDAVAHLLNATQPWFVAAVALLAGAQALALTPAGSSLLARALALAVILQAGVWLNAGIRGWLEGYVAHRRQADATSATTATILGFVARVVLWSLVLLMVLDNLGFDVTALVASLGIGGIAVALATQNILGDVFASLAIALDKPVVIGDFVILGEVMGTVERVGLKTTHLRSLSGELIVLPNSDLLSSRIRNYKRMFERRVLFKFGVTYQTPPGTLQRIPGIVRDLVEGQALARFDRAHFATFGDSALEFEVVYFVRDPDYNRYMDVQQQINFGLIAALDEAGVEFAYPTRTIHIATSAAAP